MWYAPDGLDTASAPTDLRFPRELAGLLDTLWSEIDSGRGPGGSSATQTDLVHRLGNWYSGRFKYDLDVPQEKGLDPLRVFFRRRRGYCEYFASGAVLLLRRAGIPARYATGLSNPEPVAGRTWWVYRQGGAHAWVEWRPAGGVWRTFDPTPAVSTIRSKRDGWMSMTEIVVGWGRLAWHVLRDGNWRTELEDWKSRIETLPVWIWFGTGAVALVGIWAWLLPRRSGTLRSVGPTEWERELARAESLLRRQGHVRGNGETVGRFLHRIPKGLDPKALAILRSYQAARWRPATNHQRNG